METWLCKTPPLNLDFAPSSLIPVKGGWVPLCPEVELRVGVTLLTELGCSVRGLGEPSQLDLFLSKTLHSLFQLSVLGATVGVGSRP